MSFRLTSRLVVCLLTIPLVLSAQTHRRRNFYGMHNLKDGGASIPEGMNWTRHLVGEGGYVFDWVRGDYGRWVVDAMDRGLIPCIRIQNCNGGCDPDPGYPEQVATDIREHLERYRPQYLDRLIYLQLWNEPGDSRDYVSPERFADFLVEANAGVKLADPRGVFRTMTPGQNGPDWWRQAIRHNPAVCQAFDVWATHPYPESYPPRYNHHDGVPFVNQVKTIDSYLLDLDGVASECAAQGSPRRGFPVMITETAYGDHLGISYEGYPKTTRGPICTTDGPCDFGLASQYNVAAFTEYWRKWPEILAVHPFILNNWSWDAFAFVSRGSGSRADEPVPSWCPPEDPDAATPWPPGYSTGAKRCGLPDAPYPQYKALLDLEKPPPAALTPYHGPVGTLRGRVTRQDTGAPVRFATVATEDYELGGPTLSDGIFVVHDVPVGTYTLSAEKLGYGTVSKTVTVSEDMETVADFSIPYFGKVSKGIYFQNQGTCSNCDLFASFLGESFTVPDDVGYIKFAAAMPNVGNVLVKFSILEGGPTGPPVGAPVTAFLEWGGEMIGAEWPGDGVPVVPGGVYFLKVERADGQGVYLYATDANPYGGGMAYTGTTPHPGWDLFATIRGNTLAVEQSLGTLTGVVTDASSRPIGGASVTATPGSHTTLTGTAGEFTLSVPPGSYAMSASAAGYEPESVSGIAIAANQTVAHDFVLTASTTTPPADLLTNGDFQQGLQGWSVWVERGDPNPTIDSGRLHIAGTGHNGGVYQTFATGGAGTEIEIDGSWASGPTVPAAQWAEVLILNGTRLPVNGQDLAAGGDVLLVYKNDTWTSSRGWSGILSRTSPVHEAPTFVAAGDVATLVLKSGNLPGVVSGTFFDDVTARATSAPPPPPPPPPPPANHPPVAQIAASPSSGTAPLTVSFDGSGSSDPDSDPLSFEWSFGDGAVGSGASPTHSFTAAGSFTVSLTVSDGKGGSDSAWTTISVSDSAPASLIQNGDFSRGLEGWSVWKERGDPSIDASSGKLAIAGTGYNAGIYQTFATGGAGSEIHIEGFWESSPTSASSQWAEVLVIDGPNRPVDGQDVNGDSPGVVLVYKNDTWTSPSGWSGTMSQTAPVAARGSFVASSDVATLVLKSGNVPGASTGTRFDDVVVSRAHGSPPELSGQSKLSIHSGFGGPKSMEFVQRAKPRILKILDAFSAATEVKRLSPSTGIIGRAYLSEQPMDGDPVERARQWWDRVKGSVLQYPEIDYWEGYNEPVIQSPELMRWYANFEAERVRILASNGRKACIGSFSVGNPDLPLWPSFYPAIDAAKQAGGILGLHEYGTPMQQDFDEPSGEGWLTGRYRKVYRNYLIPDGRVLPLAITETGVDNVAPVGWKNHFTDEEYLEQLKWYDRLLLEDDYVLGATIFALEIPGWYSFDIAPIVDRLADYVAIQ